MSESSKIIKFPRQVLDVSSELKKVEDIRNDMDMMQHVLKGMSRVLSRIYGQVDIPPMYLTEASWQQLLNFRPMRLIPDEDEELAPEEERTITVYARDEGEHYIMKITLMFEYDWFKTAPVLVRTDEEGRIWAYDLEADQWVCDVM